MGGAFGTEEIDIGDEVMALWSVVCWLRRVRSLGTS